MAEATESPTACCHEEADAMEVEETGEETGEETAEERGEITTRMMTEYLHTPSPCLQ